MIKQNWNISTRLCLSQIVQIQLGLPLKTKLDFSLKQKGKFVKTRSKKVREQKDGLEIIKISKLDMTLDSDLLNCYNNIIYYFSKQWRKYSTWNRQSNEQIKTQMSDPWEVPFSV